MTETISRNPAEPTPRTIVIDKFRRAWQNTTDFPSWRCTSANVPAEHWLDMLEKYGPVEIVWKP